MPETEASGPRAPYNATIPQSLKIPKPDRDTGLKMKVLHIFIAKKLYTQEPLYLSLPIRTATPCIQTFNLGITTISLFLGIHHPSAASTKHLPRQVVSPLMFTLDTSAPGN